MKRYEYKLKEAIMMRNRSDAYHRKGKKSAAYKLDSKCESLCEDALEILQEIVVERTIYSIVRDTAVPSNGDSFMLENFLNIND